MKGVFMMIIRRVWESLCYLTGIDSKVTFKAIWQVVLVHTIPKKDKLPRVVGGKTNYNIEKNIYINRDKK